MIVFGQRIAAGVAAGSLRQSKAQAAEERGKGHVRARLHVAAVAPGGLEVFEHEADCLDRHQVRDRLMILAPVALQGMGQRIQTGIHGRARGHRAAEDRVDDGSLRHEDRVVDGALFRAVAHDRNLGHLAAGTGGSRHGNNCQALRGEGHLPAVIVLRVPVAESDRRGKLCGVDGAAAADAHNGVRLHLTGQAGRLDRPGELGVLLHAAEDGRDAAVLLLHLQGSRGKVPAAGDHTLRNAELLQQAAEQRKLAFAEDDLDRLGIDKLTPHRCSPRFRRPWRQTCAC